MWVLRHVRSPGSSEPCAYNIQHGKSYSVGRENSDILLSNDTSVSRKHCVIWLEHPEGDLADASKTTKLMVRDLSKFGVFIDEKKITKGIAAQLHNGALIRFGYNCLFKVEEVRTGTSSRGVISSSVLGEASCELIESSSKKKRKLSPALLENITNEDDKSGEKLPKSSFRESSVVFDAVQQKRIKIKEEFPYDDQSTVITSSGFKSVQKKKNVDAKGDEEMVCSYSPMMKISYSELIDDEPVSVYTDVNNFKRFKKFIHEKTSSIPKYTYFADCGMKGLNNVPLESNHRNSIPNSYERGEFDWD